MCGQHNQCFQNKPATARVSLPSGTATATCTYFCLRNHLVTNISAVLPNNTLGQWSIFTLTFVAIIDFRAQSSFLALGALLRPGVNF